MTILDFPRPVEDEDWRLSAKCRGMNVEWFFPTFPEDIAEVVAFCADCPVKVACQIEARDVTEGVWGGLTAEERRVARRKRMRKS